MSEAGAGAIEGDRRAEGARRGGFVFTLLRNFCASGEAEICRAQVPCQGCALAQLALGALARWRTGAPEQRNLTSRARPGSLILGAGATQSQRPAGAAQLQLQLGHQMANRRLRVVSPVLERVLVPSSLPRARICIALDLRPLTHSFTGSARLDSCSPGPGPAPPPDYTTISGPPRPARPRSLPDTHSSPHPAPPSLHSLSSHSQPPTSSRPLPSLSHRLLLLYQPRHSLFFFVCTAAPEPPSPNSNRRKRHFFCRLALCPSVLLAQCPRFPARYSNLLASLQFALFLSRSCPTTIHSR